MRWIVAYFILGILVFNLWAMFETSDLWVNAYHLWEKIKDILLFCLIREITPKKFSKLLWPVIAICTARLLIEIVHLGWGLSINNPALLGIIFILLNGHVLYTLIKDARS